MSNIFSGVLGLYLLLKNNNMQLGLYVFGQLHICCSFAPVYQHCGFKSSNQDVIEVQTFYLNSRHLTKLGIRVIFIDSPSFSRAQ